MKVFTKLAMVCVVGVALLAGAVDSVKAAEYEDEVVIEACMGLANDEIQYALPEGTESVIEVNKFKVVGNTYIININSTVVVNGNVTYIDKFFTIVCELKDDTVYTNAIPYVDM